MRMRFLLAMSVALGMGGMPAMAQSGASEDTCAYTFQSMGWELALSYRIGYSGDGTMHYDYAYEANGLTLWVAVPLDGAGRFGYRIHEFLDNFLVEDRLEDLPSTADTVYGQTRRYDGVLEITFSDPESGWSWSERGELTHGQQPGSSRYQYDIIPEDLTKDVRPMFEYLWRGEAPSVRVEATFTPTGGAPVILRAEPLATHGLSELVNRSEEYVSTLTTTCPAARANN